VVQGDLWPRAYDSFYATCKLTANSCTHIFLLFSRSVIDRIVRVVAVATMTFKTFMRLTPVATSSVPLGV
jgi:hypothetical protein